MTGCHPEQIESLWVPDLEVSDDPDAWHPLDALYAPLYSANGDLIGNMAVDLPPGNTIPNQQQRELLEMFAVQAGLALENAQRREQLSRQVRLGEALKKLALLAGQDELEPALQEAAEALFEALPLAQVSIRCFADHTEDPENYSAGRPDRARADEEMVLELRQDLVRLSALGNPEPYPFSVRENSFGALASEPLLRRQLERHGWSHGVLTPIGVDREVLGYLAVLRSDDQPGFDHDETGALHEAGRELGRLVRDVRLRRTERRLLAELRELDRYKGELIATISHELKTPLTSDHRPHRAAGGVRRTADVGRRDQPQRGPARPAGHQPPQLLADPESPRARAGAARPGRPVRLDARDAAHPGPVGRRHPRPRRACRSGRGRG